MLHPFSFDDRMTTDLGFFLLGCDMTCGTCMHSGWVRGHAMYLVLNDAELVRALHLFWFMCTAQPQPPFGPSAQFSQ